MAGQPETLTFAEFGRRLLTQAVTPQLLRRGVLEALPGEETHRLSTPFEIVVKVRAEVGQITPQPARAPEYELSFAVPMRIHLRLLIDLSFGFNLAQEAYDAVVDVDLHVHIKMLAPLTIFADIDPVQPRDLRVATEGKNNVFDLVKRFTGLEGEIRRGVAQGINEQIALSFHDRFFPLDEHLRAMDDAILPTSANAHPPDL